MIPEMIRKTTEKCVYLFVFALTFSSHELFSQQDTIVQAKILDDGSQDAEKAFNAGITFFNEKKYSEAISEFDKAIQLKPTFDKAYFHRGNAKQESKDLTGAMSDYTTAIGISQQAEYFFSRAQLKYAQKDLDGAKEDYTQTLTFDTGNA